MERFKLTVSYDGTAYAGWQVQPGVTTIQSEIQRCLKIILKVDHTVFAAGRTDAGVHAMGQVAHFDCDGGTNRRRLMGSLNGLLPPDIRILGLEKVDKSFDARKSSRSKTYIYLVSDEDVSSPLLSKRVYYHFRELDLSLMRKAGEMLIGEHDFNAFKAANGAAKTSVRTIYSFSVERVEILGHPVIQLSYTGSGFLKYMVRNITGTLIEVGVKKLSVNNFLEILKSRDRINAGPTAVPWGLYLKEINY